MTERLLMRQVREILRLKYEQRLPAGPLPGLRAWGWARCRSTAAGPSRRAEVALPPEWTTPHSKPRLFQRGATWSACPGPGPTGLGPPGTQTPSVTLQRCTSSTCSTTPTTATATGQFCRHYHDWARTLAPPCAKFTGREKAFVDFSGQRPAIVDVATGELVSVERSSACWGRAATCAPRPVRRRICPRGSPLTCGGGGLGRVPALFVPDNLKSGAPTPAARARINRTYLEFAEHYGAAVVPARADHLGQGRRRGQCARGAALDPGGAAPSPLLRRRRAERRHLVLLADLNARPMRRLGVSRRALFAQLTAPAAPPAHHAYEVAERGTPGSHRLPVAVEHNYYSVPSQLVHQRIESGSRRRSSSCSSGAGAWPPSPPPAPGRDATDPATCRTPIAPTPNGPLPPGRLGADDGAGHGRARHGHPRGQAPPEQGYRACLGLMRLGKAQGPAAWERPPRAPPWLGAPSYRTVQNILASGLDRVPLAAGPAPHRRSRSNPTIRGRAYYNSRGAPRLASQPPRQTECLAPARPGRGLPASSVPPSSPTLSFEDRVGRLVDSEWPHREQRQVQRRLRQPNLRRQAALEDIDWQRSAPRSGQGLVQSLATGPGSLSTANLLLIGPTGIGKSWLGEPSPSAPAALAMPPTACAPRASSTSTSGTSPAAMAPPSAPSPGWPRPTCS